jgi:hypothetical protein
MTDSRPPFDVDPLAVPFVDADVWCRGAADQTPGGESARPVTWPIRIAGRRDWLRAARTA